MDVDDELRQALYGDQDLLLLAGRSVDLAKLCAIICGIRPAVDVEVCEDYPDEITLVYAKDRVVFVTSVDSARARGVPIKGIDDFDPEIKGVIICIISTDARDYPN